MVESVWQELLANPRCAQLGGYLDGELVSACTLTMIPNLTRGCRPYGLIENVVTHAAHRSRGHGKALMAHALSLAWAGHCYKVMLLTGRTEEAVYRFYESAGSTGMTTGLRRKPPTRQRARRDAHPACWGVDGADQNNS